MQPEDDTPQAKALSIAFDAESISKLPVYYANAITVTVGASEFYISLGAVTPPELKRAEDLLTIDQLVAQPYIRIAVTPQIMRQFIDVMQKQFDQFLRLAQAELDKAREEEGK